MNNFRLILVGFLVVLVTTNHLNAQTDRNISTQGVVPVLETQPIEIKQALIPAEEYDFEKSQALKSIEISAEYAGMEINDESVEITNALIPLEEYDLEKAQALKSIEISPEHLDVELEEVIEIEAVLIPIEEYLLKNVEKEEIESK